MTAATVTTGRELQDGLRALWEARDNARTVMQLAAVAPVDARTRMALSLCANSIATHIKDAGTWIYGPEWCDGPPAAAPATQERVLPAPLHAAMGEIITAQAYAYTLANLGLAFGQIEGVDAEAETLAPFIMETARALDTAAERIGAVLASKA